ncbi:MULTISPECIES: murein hydrolase activator EnvC family protein [unclassified Campylobacter]|uniref:murein hydrolase activator EnvC family protein n=2 Tax=Campylobacter TaxID=194 RepID=UPI0022E9D09E|nr:MULTISPECIES: M23 family metallopeptidase [unclassified Campylobacter]MDA3048312.1 peptidoglycan DD-metalloendopeptidase family protein [Campylobacter sp. JMF_08 NE1]MDA3061872.1 peptidoglycan DD-metalloendopeptidase family protein [Campylobacter sp. JMF_14 EL1]
MKRLMILCALAFFAYGAPTTKEKIAQSNKELKTSKQEEMRLSKKIDEIADLIVQEQNDFKKRENEIKELSQNIEELKEKYANEEQELENLKKQNATLLSVQSELENKIVQIISQELSFDLISDTNSSVTPDSIVASEVLGGLESVMNSELNKLMKDYENNKNFIDEQNKKIAQINENMESYSQKKINLSEKQNAQKEKVASLQKNKDSYIAQLEKLNAEQDAIAKTLAELKIIDDKEEREKAEREERERIAKLEAQKKKEKEAKQKELEAKKKEYEKQKAAAKKAGKEAPPAPKFEPEPESEPSEPADERVSKINTKVKQYGSSYQSSRVKKYTGAKTSAPLDGAYVKRKFGNYSDPVYNIKLFNENIVLGSKSGDTQVKAVLAGKVVFAKETAVLDKVVIIEHAGGIHTIYAHLNQIPNTVRVGSSVKKGYTIGRISSDLTFEVTQQNYHINPLDLISLK